MDQPSPDEHLTPRCLLDPVLQGRRALLAIAAPTEARAVVRGITGADPDRLAISWQAIRISDRIDMVITGVGKSNAAGAVGHVLRPGAYASLLSLGVGGVLPKMDPSGNRIFDLPLGAAVRCSRSIFADEGVESQSGWQTMAERGFGPRQGLPHDRSMAIHADRHLLDLLSPAARTLADCATVSTCSGTDELAATVATRTACGVEAMEGAAVGLAALRIDPELPFLELRVISNRTGSDQGWDLPSALEGLTRLASVL